MTTSEQQQWDQYLEHERTWLVPYLTERGYTLDREQPHTAGERFLMQAVTTVSGRKVILLGKDAHQARVVIKASSERGGIRELKHARNCRSMLTRIGFAYDIFHMPDELVFDLQNDRCVTIHRYITQDMPFLERPVKEQFTYALAAFKAQERAHATTYSHLREIASIFPTYSTREYLDAFDHFLARAREDERVRAALPDLTSARGRIAEPEQVERYCGFLTHTDFVPHNFRIHEDTLYLLDHASFRFGNKHDGWARFLNFMSLYHPALETLLLQYVRDNRAPEEWESLTRMRYFRLGEIIAYYTARLDVEGDVGTLNLARVRFWSALLETLLAGRTLDEQVRTEYMEIRDRLRSAEEKKRQIGLH